MKPMGYLLCFILIIFGGALGGLFVLNYVENDDIDNPPPRIEVIQKEVTLVPLNTKPVFIKGLGKGDPPTVEKKVIYIQQGWKGILSAEKGVNIGPTNKETWYNLDMTNVINNMRMRGFDEESYPYYIRDDGVKMLGDYVMVAADLNIHPRGMVVETSLGKGLVCDTGDFAEIGDWYDIATDW